MTMTTPSDPSLWCFAELDDRLTAEDLDRFLGEHDGVEEVDEVGWPHRSSDRAESRDRLLEAIDVLSSTLSRTSRLVTSNHVLASVLEIWDLADAIDPDIAAPLEPVLGQLMLAHHAPLAELRAAIAHVRHTAEGAGPIRRVRRD